jgi:hypothetical protein
MSMASSVPYPAQVTTTAVSTVDYLALYVIMMDMRLKLLEDCVDQQRVGGWGAG